MTTDAFANITITTDDGIEYQLENPFLATFSESSVSLPAKALPDGVRPGEITSVSGTRSGEIDANARVEYKTDTEGRDGTTHHEFIVTNDRRTDGGQHRGRADEANGRLWGGDCIRCDWFIKGAGTREQVVEQARAHRERAAREGGMRDAHKVVVQDPDADLDGLAIGLMTPYTFRELDRYEGGCQRNGCENGGTIGLTTPTGMEQTDWDEPTPGGTISPDDINAVCEECAGEYDNNLLFDEGPTSVKGFLESEKR